MLSQKEVDQLRREFAERLNSLISEEENEKKLETFSRKTGLPMRMLSQWRQARHVNWPSTPNLIALSKGAGVTIDWLVLGKGRNGKHK
jgi:transcriptional regulator with XRE-family HTH domain